MRTILYSTEHVSANNWETGLFILFLMVFAIAASAYVLYHGLQASPTLVNPKFWLQIVHPKCHLQFVNPKAPIATCKP